MDIPRFEILIDINDTETGKVIVNDCYYTDDMYSIISGLEDIIEKIKEEYNE